LDALTAVRSDLVAANRILGREEILDAFGHVSARIPGEPEHFLLSRARSPELVEEGDLLEFGLDGEPVADGPRSYVERYIHAAIYAARDDVTWICHNHALSILPFSLSDTSLRPVIHTAGFLAAGVPVWDIFDDSADTSSLLVRSIDAGRSLAKCLGDASVALLRAHGSVVVGRSAPELVRRCTVLDRNARVQQAAERLGTYRPLQGPDGAPWQGDPDATNPRDNRDWEYFQKRAGLR
jgi:ribulose-5-phosphate 4-epimerase/fuculose-1-phosphate aldolase